ncbi:MAG: phytoene desaturase family protein [Anaerolineaceae bacterium]
MILADGNWDDLKEEYIQKELDYYSRFAMPGLKEHVQYVECSTPLDYERRLCLPEGAIYAFQQDLTAQAIFRPAARSKNIRGLYLTGASTHPGGGVPSTIASGMIAANLIEKYEQ